MTWTEDAGGNGESGRTMSSFESPRTAFEGLESTRIAALVAATSDITLVIDSAGVIRDVAYGSEALLREGFPRWIGRTWLETVTPESRAAVESLLRDARAGAGAQRRPVDHPSPRGPDVRVTYSIVRLGTADRMVAIGRDLRDVASLQARLVEAQQTMNRDHGRLRQVETRFRLLFQKSGEAALIVDAATERITEANPAAARLLGDRVDRIAGRSFAECFDRRCAASVDALLASTRTAGFAEAVALGLAPPGGECRVGGAFLREEQSSFFLMRLAAETADPATPVEPPGRASMLLAVARSPDALVVTDMQGKVITANAAFHELVEVPPERHTRGASIDQWLGRPGVDFGVLVAHLRQHGSVRLFATTITGANGTVADVEITAVAVPEADPPCLGFSIRNVDRRLAWERGGRGNLPRSPEQLAELVGRVPLRDVVRNTTDAIERACILSALELTRDNRALAAEMLGLSRQSLYVKLRRFGIGDLGGASRD